MVERLWVPVSQVLLARNWNAAISFCSLTASRVANSAGVSTPLRGWRAVVVVISAPVLVGVVAGSFQRVGGWKACWGGRGRPRSRAGGPGRRSGGARRVHEGLRGPPLRKPLLPQHRCERVGLGGMGAQGGVLAPLQAG